MKWEGNYVRRRDRRPCRIVDLRSNNALRALELRCRWTRSNHSVGLEEVEKVGRPEGTR